MKVDSCMAMGILADEINTVARIMENAGLQETTTADHMLSAVYGEIQKQYGNKSNRNPDDPYAVMGEKLLKMIEAMGDVARAEQL
jgi:hypothetical protein